MSRSIHLLRRILTVWIPLPKHATEFTIKKNLRTSACFLVGAYEGDGQTTVSVINKEFTHGLLIDAVNQFGFRLNNNSQIVGPMAIFNKAIFSWNVSGDTDVSLDSLSLFRNLEPKLDVLVIGLSDFKENSGKLLPVFIEMRKHCNVEVLPTEKAIATFNFLCSEGRIVAAALIPPTRISFTSDDIQITKQRRQELYKVDFKQDFF